MFPGLGADMLKEMRVKQEKRASVIPLPRYGLPLGMAMRMRIYPHYPHISRYIRHMSDNADIRIAKYIRMAIPNWDSSMLQSTKLWIAWIVL